MVLHSLPGQRRRQRIQPRLERARDFESVGAELRRRFDEYARFACDQSIAEARFGAFAQRSDILEAHRLTGTRANHRLPQRRECGAGSLGLDYNALCRRFQIASADEAGCALGGRQDILQIEPGGREPRRIDFNLPLAHLAAEYLRLRHAGNSENLRLDHPLHYIAQFHGR
jgi:hypothetical protein